MESLRFFFVNKSESNDISGVYKIENLCYNRYKYYWREIEPMEKLLPILNDLLIVTANLIIFTRMDLLEKSKFAQ